MPERQQTFVERASPGIIDLAMRILHIEHKKNESAYDYMCRQITEGEWQIDGGSRTLKRLSVEFPCKNEESAKKLCSAFERLKSEMEGLAKKCPDLSEDQHPRVILTNIREDNKLKVTFGSPGELEIAKMYLSEKHGYAERGETALTKQELIESMATIIPIGEAKDREMRQQDKNWENEK